jgi:NAD(P)-dependent dehydrogenase (short-subunit alcohol dehydrogenase family)
VNSLAGRHALVTGSNRGIGAAIAMALSTDGAHVTLLVRNRAAGVELQRRLPGASTLVIADVTLETEVRKACAQATAESGPVHLLVNNAGSVESAPFHRSDAALFQRMLSIHLFGPLFCTQELLPGMVRERYGRIVNIASTAGVSGASYVSAYSAAKHAVVGLTRSLAMEVATKGVTVNAVCPGYTATGLVNKSIEDIRTRTGRSAAEAEAALLAGNPLKRFIAPEEVATAVRWLCDEGAASVTGQTVIIDGGELA